MATHINPTNKELANRLTTALPVYVQIAEMLHEQIEAGELAPGDRLSSERDLSQQLQVNRLTVRRALQVLETRGLINRRHGDGTYVAQPKIERQAGQLVPFTPTMQQQGYTPGAKVITFEKQPVNATVAQKLQLPISAPVYHIHRVRLINEEPVMLEKFFVSCRLFPDFDSYDHVHRSGYEIMTKEYNITVEQAEQSLEPVIANEYEAALLDIEVGAPLMLERRLSFDKDGHPVECGKDLYRGDRFRFVTEAAPLKLSFLGEKGTEEDSR
ncbi:MAG: GntR family transcriptional regulator [Chloroflexota bacterium]